MIYFDADLQDRVVRTFHYALRPGAALFLGSSESLSRSGKLFTTVDKKHRIFQRRDAETMLPTLSRSTPLIGAPPTKPLSFPIADDRIDRSARRALEKYSPVYVVIDKRHDVVRFSGSEIGHYLGPSPGTASLNLFEILRKPLRPVVRAALQTMSATRAAVVQSDVAFKLDGKSRAVTVITTPLTDGSHRSWTASAAVFPVGHICATGRKSESQVPQGLAGRNLRSGVIPMRRHVGAALVEMGVLIDADEPRDQNEMKLLAVERALLRKLDRVGAVEVIHLPIGSPCAL